MEFFMAETSLTNRKYNFSDADFIIFCNTLSSVMTRDLAEMAIYGITSDTISDFEDLVNAFQALPSDDLLRADLSYAVEERDNKRNIVMNFMRSIAARSKAIYGENSAKYRALSTGNISRMQDSNLLLAAGQVHSAATTNLTELAAEGVTALYLTEFQTAITNFEASINDVSDKKNLRDNGTENKISKGNELYALVVKYCDYGKLIWENISPAKYNDYVIYTQSSPGSLSAPGNLQYHAEIPSISWDAVTNATSYQVQLKPQGEETWTVIYSGSDTNLLHADAPGDYTVRVRARNDNGYGDWSLELNYTAGGGSTP